MSNKATSNKSKRMLACQEYLITRFRIASPPWRPKADAVSKLHTCYLKSKTRKPEDQARWVDCGKIATASTLEDQIPSENVFLNQ